MSFDDIDLQWFAAEDEGRTEEPSEYKLHKAREEGRVAKSPEIASALVMLLGVVTLLVMAPVMWRWCREIFVFYFSRITSAQMTQGTFYSVFLNYLLKMILPMSAIGIIAAVAANIIQNKGFIFSTKPIQPNFSKIVPKFGQYLKKTLFSMEGAFNVGKSLVKVVIVIIVAYIIIRSNIPVILNFIKTSSIPLAVSHIAWTAGKILVTGAIIFLLISIPDYLMQRRQFIESMKMTKQEQKQEYKEMEGDPEVKSHLEAAQRQLLSQNIPRAVAESDVVITNPTHFAVALKYDSAVADAPKVMAKGEDNLAQRIKAIARENEIPVIENRPLARGLYTDTRIGDIIPTAYFSAIAAVYAQIQNLKKA